MKQSCNQALKGPCLVLTLIATAILAGCGENKDDTASTSLSGEEALREHFERVIVPETSATLEFFAEECDRSGDPADCVPFALFAGELGAIRLARYWEAMHWLGVEQPGPEGVGLLLEVHEECNYFGITLSQFSWTDSEVALAGRCSYFRSEQMPFTPPNDAE